MAVSRMVAYTPPWTTPLMFKWRCSTRPVTVTTPRSLAAGSMRNPTS